MPRGQLFEYAIIHHPKEKRDAAGVVVETPKSQLLKDITSVLAESEKEVSIIASRAIPDDYTDRLSEIEIITRPL